MDRSRYSSSGVPASPAASRPTFGNQDVRSNLAVQPTASQANISLKKSSVKVARPAGALPMRAAAPVTASASTPKGPEASSAVHMLDGDAPSTPKPAMPASKDANETALDIMFTRLTSKTLSFSAQDSMAPPPMGPGKSLLSLEDDDKDYGIERSPSPMRPDMSQFLFGDEEKESAVKTIPSPILPDKSLFTFGDEGEDMPGKFEASKAKSEDVPSFKATDGTWKHMSKQELEQVYFEKATHFLVSMPSSEGSNSPASFFKHTMIKVRQALASPELAGTEKAQPNYVDTIISHVNTLAQQKGSIKSLNEDSLRDTLKNGGLLRLCVKLMDDNLLASESLDGVIGLCMAIDSTFPKEAAEHSVPEAKPRSVPNSPMDKIYPWPAQEKREGGPSYRTCTLKGISEFNTINKLQALVWGGRLESISFNEPGSDSALVKFLTPEGFQKYFDATENGIKVPGANDTVILVEKQSGPNSVNDVMRNCADGDASRCVRAVNVDDDWSDMALDTLARGKSQVKREVDCIKRGKTTRGLCYVEFRFASIYHALSFKRALVKDIEWEHCNISFAPDPCDGAQGVHFDE